MFTMSYINDYLKPTIITNIIFYEIVILKKKPTKNITNFKELFVVDNFIRIKFTNIY